MPAVAEKWSPGLTSFNQVTKVNLHMMFVVFLWDCLGATYKPPVKSVIQFWSSLLLVWWWSLKKLTQQQPKWYQRGFNEVSQMTDVAAIVPNHSGTNMEPQKKVSDSFTFI